MKTKPRVTLQQIKKFARQLGASAQSICYSAAGYWSSVVAEAPIGQLWAATGDTHMLRTEWRSCDKEHQQVALTDLMERMKLGLCDCDDPDCDYCHA
jgi:hypothetical protein